jgi:hypothetical protein
MSPAATGPTAGTNNGAKIPATARSTNIGRRELALPTLLRTPRGANSLGSGPEDVGSLRHLGLLGPHRTTS